MVLADLEQMRSLAETVVACLPEPARATFIPVNIVDWMAMFNEREVRQCRYRDCERRNNGVLISLGEPRSGGEWRP